MFCPMRMPEPAKGFSNYLPRAFARYAEIIPYLLPGSFAFTVKTETQGQYRLFAGRKRLQHGRKTIQYLFSGDDTFRIILGRGG